MIFGISAWFYYGIFLILGILMIVWSRKLEKKTRGHPLVEVGFYLSTGITVMCGLSFILMPAPPEKWRIHLFFLIWIVLLLIIFLILLFAYFRYLWVRRTLEKDPNHEFKRRF